MVTLSAAITSFAIGAWIGLHMGRDAGYQRTVEEGRREAARRHLERIITSDDAGRDEAGRIVRSTQ